jgi:hypothetical protein
VPYASSSARRRVGRRSARGERDTQITAWRTTHARRCSAPSSSPKPALLASGRVGQAVGSQEEMITGKSEPPGSWQGTQAAVEEVMNYGHSTHK